MVLVLTESTIEDLLNLSDLADVVENALIKETTGGVERPERPHFPVGQGIESDRPLGTGLTMPAYIHGDEQYATKLADVHGGNTDRGLPTVHAQILLTNARTGVPEAFMGGVTVTNARTGCIGAVAVRKLAPEAATLGVIGAGTQARWQTRAIDSVVDMTDVRIYAPSDSKEECADDLRAADIPARAVETPRAAVEGSDVVVTATTATEPVFPADALGPTSLVVAVGAFTEEMQELEPGVFDRAEAAFADVPAEAAEVGDALAAGLGAEDFVALGELLAGDDQPPDGITVVKSVGSATLDAAASTTLYKQARERGVGREISLSSDDDTKR